MALVPPVSGAPVEVNVLGGNNIWGGNITTFAGNQNLNQTVNIIQAPVPPPEDEVKVVLKILRKHVDTKTWGVHRLVSEARAPETGKEFYSGEDMVQWRTTPRGFIWATGSPGAGKTHLASSVFDRLHTELKNDEDKVVVITYLRYNDDTTDWDAVVGLLIHLVESKPLPSVLEVIKTGFAEHEQRNSRPTFQQLSQILQTVVRKYKRCYIIIDGLDESKWEIQIMLINLLATLDANILLMSRVLQLVQDRLQELRSNRAVFVTVAACDGDLDRYITHVIDTNPRLAKLLADPKRQAKLRKIAKRKAEGMFLHLSLQMEALRDCLDIRSIFDVVNNFPTGVAALYRETLKRIDRQPHDHGRRARRALAWILYSNRPLLITDVLHAIAVSPDHEIEQDRIICEGDLAMICCGLVAVDEKTRRVRLVHETAQHHLGQLLKEEPSGAHEMIALTCMKLLGQAGLTNSSISTLEELNTAFANTPLLEYAYRSVGYHIREGLKEQPSLLPQVLQFLRDCRSFPYHHSMLDTPDPNMTQLLSPLHVAVWLDLPQAVHKLVKDKATDVNAKSTTSEGRPGWSSLMIACVEGRGDVIPELFISSRLDASAVSCHEDLTPLMVASSQGHDAVVQALLASNTRVDRVLANTAKLVGTSTGKRFVEINRRSTNMYRETALMMASRKGHTAVVSSLLAATDVDVGVMSTQGHTAYIIAIKNNQPGVVQLFHDSFKLDVNTRYSGGMTPLMFASESGSLETVRMILGIPGVDLTLRNHVGHSSLSLASLSGHRHIVELLLAVPGFDPNLRGTNGDSRLTVSAYWGLSDVVKGLLAVPGIDANLCNNDGNSALIRASSEGRTKVVELLLAVPEVDVNICNIFGNSALMQASWHGCTEAVKLLLAAPGVNLNLCNNTGYSALVLASMRGNVEVVKLLLAAPGVDLNLCSNTGYSALMQASRDCYMEVVKLLLAAPGIDLDIRNIDGKSALDLALEQRHKRYRPTKVVIELLKAALSDRSR